ncbi:hypothetical protein ACVDG8_011795 [Mesorhizobium sp. ORM8.1]
MDEEGGHLDICGVSPVSAYADKARRRGFIAAQSRGLGLTPKPLFLPFAPFNRA